jgi:Sec-independent protein translocase protein TatA
MVPSPMLPSPTNPSATGAQPGTGGPPPTNGCGDLVNAIRDLTREVREFKEAYKQVNRDKLQKVGLDRTPEQQTVESGLARLKAAQAGEAVGMGRDVDGQLAELKQAQTGSTPTTVVAR